MDHPGELGRDPHHLLTNTDFDKNPYRHPDRLYEAWVEGGSVTGAADILGKSVDSVSRWLHIYGYRERPTLDTLAHELERMDPEDLGGERP